MPILLYTFSLSVKIQSLKKQICVKHFQVITSVSSESLVIQDVISEKVTFNPIPFYFTKSIRKVPFSVFKRSLKCVTAASRRFEECCSIHR